MDRRVYGRIFFKEMNGWVKKALAVLTTIVAVMLKSAGGWLPRVDKV
jgi:hypothetical protein